MYFMVVAIFLFMDVCICRYTWQRGSIKDPIGFNWVSSHSMVSFLLLNILFLVSVWETDDRQFSVNFNYIVIVYIIMIILPCTFVHAICKYIFCYININYMVI